jgi:membrane protease YdiL (CAAX protease family)
MPAVFEELAFRGVILTSLTRVMGSTEAGVVSAFMFMVLHLSVPSFPHLLLMGLALAYIRLKSGSVLPGMLLHFTHNLLCVVAEHRVGPHFFL